MEAPVIQSTKPSVARKGRRKEGKEGHDTRPVTLKAGGTSAPFNNSLKETPSKLPLSTSSTDPVIMQARIPKDLVNIEPSVFTFSDSQSFSGTILPSQSEPIHLDATCRSIPRPSSPMTWGSSLSLDMTMPSFPSIHSHLGHWVEPIPDLRPVHPPSFTVIDHGRVMSQNPIPSTSLCDKHYSLLSEKKKTPMIAGENMTSTIQELVPTHEHLFFAIDQKCRSMQFDWEDSTANFRTKHLYPSQSSWRENELYSLILAYQNALSNTSISGNNWRKCSLHLKQSLSRIWDISHTSKSCQAMCGDLELVQLSYLNQSASLNETELNDFSMSLADRITMCQAEAPEFVVLFARKRIQRFLDLLLPTLPENTDSLNSASDLLDILFYFARTSVESKSNQSSEFIEDVRHWLSACISFLLSNDMSFNFQLCINMHMVRLKGIGSWGHWFVQPRFSLPKVNAYARPEPCYMYLQLLCTILSPIPEIKEDVLRLESNLEAQISTELEWTFVTMRDLDEQTPLVYLSDSDYCRLLEQFDTFGFMSSLWFACVEQLPTYRSLLHYSTVTQRLFRLIRQALIFSRRILPDFHKALVMICRAFAIFTQHNWTNSPLALREGRFWEDEKGVAGPSIRMSDIIDQTYFLWTQILPHIDESVISELDVLTLNFASMTACHQILAFMLHAVASSSDITPLAFSGKTTPDTISPEIVMNLNSLFSSPVAFRMAVVYLSSIGCRTVQMPPYTKECRNFISSILKVLSLSLWELESIPQTIGVELVCEILTSHSHAIGFLFDWSVAFINSLEQDQAKSLSFFTFLKALPWHKWLISESQLRILLGICHSDQRIKCQIGRHILSVLPWEQINDTPEAVLNSATNSLHFLAGSCLLNIHLDQILTGSSFLSSRTDSEDWIWAVMLQLDLSPHGASSAFLSVRHPALATARNAMHSNAMAAFMILKLTEVGCIWDEFMINDGPSLLLLIVRQAHRLAFFAIMNVLARLCLDPDQLWNSLPPEIWALIARNAKDLECKLATNFIENHTRVDSRNLDFMRARCWFSLLSCIPHWMDIPVFSGVADSLVKEALFCKSAAVFKYIIGHFSGRFEAQKSRYLSVTSLLPPWLLSKSSSTPSTHEYLRFLLRLIDLKRLLSRENERLEKGEKPAVAVWARFVSSIPADHSLLTLGYQILLEMLLSGSSTLEPLDSKLVTVLKYQLCNAICERQKKRIQNLELDCLEAIYRWFNAGRTTVTSRIKCPGDIDSRDWVHEAKSGLFFAIHDIDLDHAWFYPRVLGQVAWDVSSPVVKSLPSFPPPKGIPLNYSLHSREEAGKAEMRPLNLKDDLPFEIVRLKSASRTSTQVLTRAKEEADHLLVCARKVYSCAQKTVIIEKPCGLNCKSFAKFMYVQDMIIKDPEIDVDIQTHLVHFERLATASRNFGIAESVNACLNIMHMIKYASKPLSVLQLLCDELLDASNTSVIIYHLFQSLLCMTWLDDIILEERSKLYFKLLPFPRLLLLVFYPCAEIYARLYPAICKSAMPSKDLILLLSRFSFHDWKGSGKDLVLLLNDVLSCLSGDFQDSALIEVYRSHHRGILRLGIADRSDPKASNALFLKISLHKEVPLVLRESIPVEASRDFCEMLDSFQPRTIGGREEVSRLLASIYSGMCEKVNSRGSFFLPVTSLRCFLDCLVFIGQIPVSEKKGMIALQCQRILLAYMGIIPCDGDQKCSAKSTSNNLQFAPGWFIEGSEKFDRVVECIQELTRMFNRILDETLSWPSMIFAILSVDSPSLASVLVDYICLNIIEMHKHGQLESKALTCSKWIESSNNFISKGVYPDSLYRLSCHLVEKCDHSELCTIWDLDSVDKAQMLINLAHRIWGWRLNNPTDDATLDTIAYNIKTVMCHVEISEISELQIVICQLDDYLAETYRADQSRLVGSPKILELNDQVLIQWCIKVFSSNEELLQNALSMILDHQRRALYLFWNLVPRSCPVSYFIDLAILSTNMYDETTMRHMKGRHLEMLLTFVNKIPTNASGKLCDTITSYLSHSVQPLTDMQMLLTKIASAKLMALFTECCLRRMVSRSHGMIWSTVLPVFAIPELSETAFITACLVENLPLSLYAVYSIRSRNPIHSKEACKTRAGLLLDWMKSIHAEKRKMAGIESHNLLLVHAFLLNLKMYRDLADSEMNTGILSHEIRADVIEILQSWCRSASFGRGLWAALGFGQERKGSSHPQHPVTEPFRVFCAVLVLALKRIDLPEMSQSTSMSMSSFPARVFDLAASKLSPDLKCFGDTIIDGPLHDLLVGGKDKGESGLHLIFEAGAKLLIPELLPLLRQNL